MVKNPHKNNLPLNIILFGPPGTGKTYHSINESVEIIDPEFYQINKEDRESLRSFYNEKLIVDWETTNGQIVFCTFHQSFSYEDFVEGIKPQKPTDSDTYLKYNVEDGIFKRMCLLAEKNLKSQNIQNQKLISLTEEEFKNAQFYKLSLGDYAENETKALYEYWKENNVISIGFGDGLDFTGKNEAEVTALYQEKYKDDFGANAINLFKNYLKTGNYIVISKGNQHVRAIGKVTGEYFYDPTTEMRHKHFRKVSWIFNDQEIPVEDIYTKNLSQQTIYKMKSEGIQKSFFIHSSVNEIPEEHEEQKNYVLIIDEINRGNVASIFGELITLIETDKRAGNNEELKVVLPYSKDSFTVPSNLYLIGTMNTADRSIEALDTALRRRFSFKEMAPDPALIRMEGSLKDSNGMINDVDVVALMIAINDRIEKLIDKDHKIGHAYFMDLETIDDLKLAFKDKVIPLLEEYFFGDYGKIGLVLGVSFVAQSSSETFSFANFSAYDGQITQDLADRAIYKIKPADEWDFVSVYTQTAKS
ncbi:MAG: AAA family ATPase [Saprospiraceae bacterium]|nr:AAA family ATPase [Saprospiraceae bacterium]